MQSKRELRKRRRIRGRRRKRNGGPLGREKGRWGSWCGQIERGLCLLLSAVRNLRMRSWSVVEKFSLKLSFDFYFMDGKKIEVFIFLFFLLIDLFVVFFVQCFTIIIIKCKASFSCHSSSSHYSTKGFILISFHFIFLF